MDATRTLLLALSLALASHVAGATDLIISSGNSVTLTTGSYSYGQVQVQSGAGLFINGAVSISVTSGDFTVQAGAVVIGSGMGYGGGFGPGINGSGMFTGGGHGGIGGNTSNNSYQVGPTYDDPTDPQQMGSGGSGYQNSPDMAGNGGAALIVGMAAGTAQLDGQISMDGGDAQTSDVYRFSGSGGGAGGTINISAPTVSGGGSLTARGGQGGA